MTETKDQFSLKRFWNLLVDYLKPQKGRVFLLVFLALFSIGLQLLNPQIIRLFLDSVEARSGLDQLLNTALLFTGVALLSQVIQLVVTLFGEIVAWTATNNLRADLALHCLNLDMTFHKKHKPGELIERVDGDVTQLANFFSQLVIKLGGNLLLVVGVIVLLFLQNRMLGFSIVVIALIGLIVLNWFNKRTVPRWQAVRETEAKLFGFLEEWLNGTEEIQSSGAKPYIMLRLYHSLRDRWQKILSAMRIQVFVADLPIGIFAFAYIAAFISGATLFQDGAISIGELYIIIYYIGIMEGPLWEILRQIEDLQRAAASVNRISELLNERSSLQDGPGFSFPGGPLKVLFDDVSFHYEDDLDTRVLKNLNFALKPGTVLGLLGRTGSGKSTVTKLLFRFHDPTSGAIRIGRSNGTGDELKDIRQARRSDLRQRIGMVTQDVQIFQATLRQNLTLFDDAIKDANIMEVIKDVGLTDWYEKLPHGLDTKLEAGGSGLSAGEAQLLAFGRVFLNSPGLVVLDEASSRLDPATENRIEKAVDKLLANRTGIIIAHRLATVQRADEIMILEDGQIVEYGRREELANDPDSHFYKLLQTGLEEALV